MGEVIWLGVLLGVGAALSVGPIFVTILNEAATRGFGAAFRVILGSATADVILLLPALAFAWVIAAIAQAAFWVGLVGAAFFLWLAVGALRDAVRLWRAETAPTAEGWAFWKGVVGNLANPLTWTFWLATGTPAMLRAKHLAGSAGLAVFTVTWFVVASGLEAVIALAVARSGRRIGHRGQGAFTGLSAAVFVALAGLMVSRSAG
ncbi:LysE family transporter [Actinoallomurus purpureus]|uniref:LysE family translocator n=1 Tax=Actinoallomurus purpureus TaxID=478114 RepID=UPI002093BC0C|nr:LysE family transporter [Actinoallomurus purpureus]MCO6009511.1 LysE family transporter [Actinoallomurus purpureus]